MTLFRGHFGLLIQRSPGGHYRGPSPCHSQRFGRFLERLFIKPGTPFFEFSKRGLDEDFHSIAFLLQQLQDVLMDDGLSQHGTFAPTEPDAGERRRF